MKLVAFERLLCAVWRVRQAFRMEEQKLTLQATLDAQEEKANDDTTNSVEPPRWYTTGRGPLLRAIKLVTNLRAQLVSDGGRHLEEHKDWIVGIFGPDFYDSLANWRVEDRDAILLVEHLTQHSKDYKMPLPETVPPKHGEKLVVDPRAKWDMIAKLLDVKLQDLAEIYRLVGNDNGLSGSQQHTVRWTPLVDISLAPSVSWKGIRLVLARLGEPILIA